MLPFQLSQRQKFAVDLVREVSVLARVIQEEMVTGSLTKDDRSPVTVADFAVQAVVAAKLEQHFPEEALIAEESAALLRHADGRPTLERVNYFVRRVIPDADPIQVGRWIDRGSGEASPIAWILDPVDGTKGFLRGDQYAVALALIRDGEIELGVLGCPRLDLDPEDLASIRNTQQAPTGSTGSLIAAFKGEGSWATSLGEARFRRLGVSSNSVPGDALVLHSFESGHTNLSQMESVIRLMQIEKTPVALDSQAKYALLAAGGGDLLFRLVSERSPDYREKVWDHAAGALAVEEAGGRITDINGKFLDFSHGRSLVSNRGIVASNGKLHEHALQALAETIGAV